MNNCVANYMSPSFGDIGFTKLTYIVPHIKRIGNYLLIWNLIESLMHPARRQIIKCLERNEYSFSELLKCVPIGDNHGKLGYHLRKLMSLNIVTQGTLKKYHLTERGYVLSKLIRDLTQLNI